MYMDKAVTIPICMYACIVELENSPGCEWLSQSIRSCSRTWAETQYDWQYDEAFVNSTVQHQEIAGGPSPRYPENHFPVIFAILYIIELHI